MVDNNEQNNDNKIEICGDCELFHDNVLKGKIKEVCECKVVDKIACDRFKSYDGEICGNCAFFKGNDEGNTGCSILHLHHNTVACHKFVEFEKVGLTEKDFPLKVDAIIAAKFSENRKTTAVIDQLMMSLIKSAKLEMEDPWEAVRRKIPGVENFQRELTKDGCALTYDHITEELLIKANKNY